MKSNPRDNFYTPRYAIEILLPFIPKEIDFIWECASGEGNISKVLREQEKWAVVESDLADENKSDFFDDKFIPEMLYYMKSAIITNPPFGIKKKFFLRCMELGLPFALLIPLDYSGWVIDAIDRGGCEKIIPTRRIDYVTPFICDLVVKKGLTKERHNNWRDIPEQMIVKASSSDFHSGWFTWNFGLGRSETFVDLTLDMKKRMF